MKMGMTATWDQHGVRHPLTILQIAQNQVVQIKTPQRDGYSALQIGAFDCTPKNVSKPLLFHFNSAGVPPKRVLKEFPVTPDAVLPIGSQLDVRHFVPGQYIDITGISIGKGFQGAMKRWGFSGGPATHGASLSHRSLGSTGHRKTPSRTWKNKKMHGHMGCDQVTVMNMLIYYIDPVNQLICVKGSVPGHDNNYVFLRDAVRLKAYEHNKKLGLPSPTCAPPSSPKDMELTACPPTQFKNPFTLD
eukprot:CAMPEP_0113683908 /NCGR_PEP_ID=MMETSP0038_2-20120614/13636_1 /TAXON_ID=2898 /ORGANISM="Cryptomonas paramecium" /LENGTH=245 /DNA_ID=CAMNT_0000603453 /DNA_START=101 /DNA_END=838 /DNA_ORIENTATION=- /assembly_acc=CAM_ASM_000170